MHRTSSTSMSASGMNRNKLSQVPLTSTSKHKVNSSSHMSSKAGSSASSNASKKLRTELRRVMSDRVFKITRCSQQQLQTNSSSANNLDQAKHKQPLAPSLTTNNSNEHLKDSSSSAFLTSDSKLSSDTMKSPQNPANDAQQNHSNQEQPGEANLAKSSMESRVELKDKSELIDFVTRIYNQALDETCGLSASVKRIVNAIRSFANSFGNSKQQEQKYMEEIFNEHLLKTNIQLKQKYKTDEERNSDRFRLESELQIILQIENYLSNTQMGRTGRVDEDCVWEIANSFRMLSQMFRERFKIERFLFTEIYANFHTLQSSEFILSLMEELGYDKEEQLSQLNNNNNSNNANQTDSANHAIAQQNESVSNTTLTTAKNMNEASPFKTPVSTPLKSQHNQLNPSISNLGLSRQLVGSLNNLFEEFGEKSSSSQLSTSVYVHSSHVEFDLDETSQSQQAHNNSNNDENDDLLPDLKKKKPVVRYTDFSSTTMRSIVVQKKKMRLKIRSPYKSPSKAAQMHSNPKTYSTQRKSPRLKDRQILSEDTSNRKRQRTYLITDTPDHKQNSTIITTKQEKVRKRFSFQPMSSFPVVPDTPVKGKCDPSETSSISNSYHVIATSFPVRNHIEVTPKKYSSPRKNSHLLD